MWVKTLSLITVGLVLTACTQTVKPVVDDTVDIIVDNETVDTVENILLNVEEVSLTGDISKNNHIVSYDEDSFIIMLGGSGSCPPMIDTVKYDEGNNIVSIIMQQYPENTMCTMDYRQYFYDVKLVSPVITVDTIFETCVDSECYRL